MSWRITLVSEEKIEEKDVTDIFKRIPLSLQLKYYQLDKAHGLRWTISTDIINPSFNYLVISGRDLEIVENTAHLKKFVKEQLENIGYHISYN